MARNRQRAKQRQAERRAARLARSGDGTRGAEPDRDGRPPDGKPAEPPVEIGGDAAEAAALAASAPPEDAGRSDAVLEGSTLPEEELEAEEELEPEDELAEETARQRGRQRREGERDQGRGKVLEFLGNVWAELQRVQWPNRAAVTSLTGIVLMFVLIMGGYLGLLDAIFSKLVKSII